MTRSSPLRSPEVALKRFGIAQASDVHNHHQVVLGLDGAMEMAVEGKVARIDAHQAWLVPAGMRHDYAGIGENRHLVLDLPVASLAVPERLFERARTLPLDASFGALVRTVATESSRVSATLSSSDQARRPRLHWSAAVQLCDAMLACIAGRDVSRHATASGQLDFARIDRWLRARLAEPLRIADLAAHCGIGMRRFHTLFVEAFGETPHRYLQRLRLDVSLSLLADPRHSLTDIALDVGFADQSAYTHAFSRRFGIAPGQWRAMRH